MPYGSLLVHARQQVRAVTPRRSTCALFTAE